jgi:YebC/PmpR family DNA-binding regulatory protein
MGRAFEYRKAAKLKRWGNMSRVFPKLARAITLAAKSGVPDPDMNSSLRTAINNAKSQNLPKENIEAAIKRASGKDATNLAEVNYEGKSLSGILIFIETATDNTARTSANIKDIFKKSKGKILPTGSLEYMFDRKAVIELKNSNIDIDTVELEMIDYGLDNYERDDETIYMYAEYTEFGNLTKGCEKLDLEIIKASLQRIPKNPIDITDEQMQDLEILLEKIEDDEDVQNVYTNIT